MRARYLLLAIGLPALLTGSVAAQRPDLTSDQLVEARAEWRAARADVERLELETAKARDKAARIAAERQVAAAGIIAAEAEISVLQATLSARRQAVAKAEAILRSGQAPAAALVAGLVNSGRRPPLLSLADSGSLDELVRVRMLLDTTLPVIRARTATLSAELAQRRRLAEGTASARERLEEARHALGERQARFAALEAEANATAGELDSQSMDALDRMVMTRDSAGRIGDEAFAGRDARRRAAELVTLGALPPRPTPGDRSAVEPAISYRMPATAALVEGAGSVNRDGVRSRGVRLATTRGAAIVVPASGSIAFSGPFRRHDGIVIIDHGGGWMTMVVGVRSALSKGSRVEQGEVLGRALGEIRVELTHDGRPVSAPVVAARSLSIQARGR